MNETAWLGFEFAYYYVSVRTLTIISQGTLSFIPLCHFPYYKYKKKHITEIPHIYQRLRYLLRAPPNGQVWHKAFFFGGSGRRALAHTRPAFPKNAYGPVGIPFIRGTSGCN